MIDDAKMIQKRCRIDATFFYNISDKKSTKVRDHRWYEAAGNGRWREVNYAFHADRAEFYIGKKVIWVLGKLLFLRDGL